MRPVDLAARVLQPIRGYRKGSMAMDRVALRINRISTAPLVSVDCRTFFRPSPKISHAILIRLRRE
jgi:hypothetical protein